MRVRRMDMRILHAYANSQIYRDAQAQGDFEAEPGENHDLQWMPRKYAHHGGSLELFAAVERVAILEEADVI